MTADDIRARLAQLGEQSEAIEEERDALARDVRRLTGDNAEAAIAVLESRPGEDVTTLQRKLADADAKLANNRSLCSALWQRLNDLDAARRRSEFEALRPKHRDAVRRIAESVIALAQALADERAFRDQANRLVDYTAGQLPVLNVPGIAYGTLDMREHSSNLCTYIAGLIECGYLTGEEPFLRGVNYAPILEYHRAAADDEERRRQLWIKQREAHDRSVEAERERKRKLGVPC